MAFKGSHIAALAAIAALAGCETTAPTPAVRAQIAQPTRSDVWRSIASDADQQRLARLDEAWREGVAAAKATGAGRAVLAEEKSLLEPAAGLPRPSPTPGSYRCRLVTLGSDKSKSPAAEKFKPFFCYVGLEGDQFTIVKQTGSQRPAGRLWEDDNAKRMLFLGTLALGNEDDVRAYGDDPKRDMAGWLERIGPFRWRLAIPYPQDGARIDVFELTPVAEQPAGA